MAKNPFEDLSPAAQTSRQSGKRPFPRYSMLLVVGGVLTLLVLVAGCAALIVARDSKNDTNNKEVEAHIELLLLANRHSALAEEVNFWGTREGSSQALYADLAAEEKKSQKKVDECAMKIDARLGKKPRPLAQLNPEKASQARVLCDGTSVAVAQRLGESYRIMGLEITAAKAKLEADIPLVLPPAKSFPNRRPGSLEEVEYREYLIRRDGEDALIRAERKADIAQRHAKLVRIIIANTVKKTHDENVRVIETLERAFAGK